MWPFIAMMYICTIMLSETDENVLGLFSPNYKKGSLTLLYCTVYRLHHGLFVGHIQCHKLNLFSARSFSTNGDTQR